MNRNLILLAIIIGLPGPVLWLSSSWTGIHLDHDLPIAGILIFGSGIVAAAFLLSWAGEALQKDLSGAFAMALVAIVALLPEYAVEALLAWDAGANPEDSVIVGRVAANVTGANRLLIGFGWSAVALMSWLRIRKQLEIGDSLRLELSVLTIATILSFLLFFMGEASIYLGGVLVVIYAAYLIASSRSHHEEPELHGPAALIGSLDFKLRRLSIIGLFVFSAAVIIAVVEPFIESLIFTGQRFGVSDFLLIQWLAPLASESPEILIAVLLALRGNALAGLTVVVSAEVSQLTILIASMPIVFSLSAGEVMGLPLAPRQAAEFLMTSCFSLFGIFLLARGKLGLHGASFLLVLFFIQLFFPGKTARITFSFGYLLLTGFLILRNPDSARGLFVATVGYLVAPLKMLFRRSAQST